MTSMRTLVGLQYMNTVKPRLLFRIPITRTVQTRISRALLKRYRTIYTELFEIVKKVQDHLY